MSEFLFFLVFYKMRYNLYFLLNFETGKMRTMREKHHFRSVVPFR